MTASLSSAHGLPYAANCSLLFTEHDLLDRPAAARDAGFDAVEFWWPFDSAMPSDAEVDQFAGAVERAAVSLIGLNFAAGDMPGGDRGLVSWPGRTDEFRASVDIAVALGERLGTRAFNALYGNRLADIDSEEQDDIAVQNLAYAADAVSPIGGTVLIEAVSGAPDYPLLTAADVVGEIDRVHVETGAKNVRPLVDVYHLAVNVDDVGAAIEATAGWIGHVQIADAPGRHEPGTGELDLDGFLGAIAATGYKGYVAFEFTPQTTTTDAIAGLGLLAGVNEEEST